MPSQTAKTPSSKLSRRRPAASPRGERPRTPSAFLQRRRRPAVQELQVAIVLDKSGSMQAVRHQTIDGFNEYVDSLRGRSDADIRISLTLFDNEVRAAYTAVPLHEAARLDESTYAPDGATALYDAVGSALVALDTRLGGDRRDPVLIVILTDGEENASATYTREQVREMIREREARGNWTFTFIGANQDAWVAGGALGVSAGNVASFSSTAAGTRGVFRRLGAATEARMYNAARGLSSTATLYEDAGVRQVEEDLPPAQDSTASSSTAKRWVRR